MNLKIAFLIIAGLALALFAFKPTNKFNTILLKNRNGVQQNDGMRVFCTTIDKHNTIGHTLVTQASVFEHGTDNGPELISAANTFKYESYLRIISVLSHYE